MIQKVLFLVLILTSWNQAQAVSVENKLKYPIVALLNGGAELVLKNSEVRAIKKNDIFKEKAFIRMKPNSQMRIELDEHNSLTLLENTELDIPVIDWDSGETSEIHLLKGQIRVDSQNSNQRIYTTPVTRDIYTESEFLLAYESSTGRATLTCFRGAVNFRGIEGENAARIGAGERAFFQGVLESGSPSFDVLLKGRKLARGQLSSVETLAKDNLEEIQKLSLVQKPVLPKGPPKPTRQPGQICDEPYGKLNECVWTCEGVPKHPAKPIKSCQNYQCLRRRCDANGNWTDVYKVPATESKCQVKPFVGNCDY